MILLVAACFIGLAAVTIALWKFGFVEEAEQPAITEDKPAMDPRERKALLKRLTRWREEGKLSREEFERLFGLCENDW